MRGTRRIAGKGNIPLTISDFMRRDVSVAGHRKELTAESFTGDSMQKKRLAMLQNMPIFGGIQEKILEFIVETAAIVTVAPGEYFFREHERGSSMYVLESGSVSVLKTWQGREFLLTKLSAGDCFGEMSLIDLGPRTASIIACELCSAIELSNAVIHKIYLQEPEQFMLIQMNMGREVSRRLRHTDELLFQECVKSNKIPIKSSY